MNEIDFKNWLKASGMQSKVISDCISRIKRIEKTIGNEIDNEYDHDKCEHLLLIFKNKGMNEYMKKYLPNTLPIGKYYLSAYKHAVKKYMLFISESR